MTLEYVSIKIFLSLFLLDIFTWFFEEGVIKIHVFVKVVFMHNTINYCKPKTKNILDL